MSSGEYVWALSGLGLRGWRPWSLTWTTRGRWPPVHGRGWSPRGRVCSGSHNPTDQNTNCQKEQRSSKIIGCSHKAETQSDKGVLGILCDTNWNNTVVPVGIPSFRLSQEITTRPSGPRRQENNVCPSPLLLNNYTVSSEKLSGAAFTTENISSDPSCPGLWNREAAHWVLIASRAAFSIKVHLAITQR